MTSPTKTDDKLVKMANAIGIVSIDGQSIRLYQKQRDKLAAFRAAIIAGLCGDVEPVAVVVVHDSQPAEFFCTPSFTDLPAGEQDLHPASTIAVLNATHSAEVEALKARIAELEKDQS